MHMQQIHMHIHKEGVARLTKCWEVRGGRGTALGVSCLALLLSQLLEDAAVYSIEALHANSAKKAYVHCTTHARQLILLAPPQHEGSCILCK